MKKIFKSLFAVAAVLAIGAPAIQAQSTGDPIKREMRSVWLAAVGVDFSVYTGVSGTKKVIDNTVTSLEGTNYTSICFHVRPMADALYKSELVPWSEYAGGGSRGVDPGYDPLQYAIDAAHAAGLELYAWLNPYRWQNGTTLSYNTSYDQQWKANGWAMTNSSQTVFNPGIPEVRAHIVEVVKEIINNYDVDGIIFDDYFYPGGGYTEGSDAVDYQLWKNSGTSMTMGQWRRDNVNKMVQDVYDAIQAIRPDVRFGISPAGVAGANASEYGFPSRPSGTSDWQYNKIYSDPLAWFKAGSVDFVSPQIYWSRSQSNAPYGPLSKWWSQCAGMSDRHMYVSQGPYQGFSNSENLAQTLLNRDYTENNAPGFIMFSQKSLTSSLNEYYLENATQGKVLQPLVTWHSDKEHAFTAPTGGKLSGSTLSWNAQSYGNRIVKYSVYAIPMSLSLEEAQSNDGDGISAKYLLGITYSNSYSIPSDKLSDYWFAVCVYDGFSKEWEPATINYVKRPDAPATTLVSPADGATVEGTFSLKWNSAAVDNYTVEVSKSSDFSSIVYSNTVSATSVSLTADQVGKGTFYWHVITHKADHNSMVSSSRSFKIENVSVGATEQGYFIQTDGHTYGAVNGVTIKNDWIRSQRMGNFEQMGEMNTGVQGEGDQAGSYNRDMIAVGDYLYVASRSENNSAADLWLRRYDRFTGEHMGDILVGSDANVSYYPLNDVIKDSKGNVYVANLSLNIASTPLVLCSVDVETGATAEVISLTSSYGKRVDHCNVYGDVASGNYYVFAASASTNYVIRWTISDGELSKTEYTTLSSRFPEDASNLSTAPIVIPISESDFFVDGHATALTRYTFKASGKATMTGSFEDATYQGAPVEATSLNGGVVFAFNGENYIGFPNSKDPHQFEIVKTNSSLSYSAMSKCWALPDGDNFGNHFSTTAQAPMDYITNADGSVTVYVYLPGVGLGAYTLNKISGIDNLVGGGESLSVTVSDRWINLNADASCITLYNVAGIVVASGRGASIYADVAPGYYVVRAIVDGKPVAKGVIIR